ncbi:hypothetical protein QBC46DRAFT_379035 [Diplogelasinospora grovesii]|uniref:NTF2-like domain-containing protein n=1 Tax=Diplogelasinospora grovesii TaxID=303347 RepID=A0AAN6NBV5_9PEZI|nr:hypothetical protein QBC46DRAFT_379035 [Diplogelasinospora grovesii]
MLFKTLILTGLGLVSAVALPPPATDAPLSADKRSGSCARDSGSCLSPSDAAAIVNAYKGMINHWDNSYIPWIAEDFTDQSDSINEFIPQALGATTFRSKQAFIQHEQTQPDNLPLVVQSFGPLGCTQIALIWTATFSYTSAAPQPVRGITILGTSKTGSGSIPWQIRRIDVEYNSMAFLKNIGGSYTFPPPPPSKE